MTGVWLAWSGPAASASLSARDVQIVAKILGFLDPPPAGGVVAVIYAAHDAASKRDAEAIAGMFGGGLASGGGVLRARTVAAGALGDGGGYAAIILAAGAEREGGAVAGVHGVLSITAADALVRSGRCVMAVHSQPRVDITISRMAARAAGVNFTAAFGMLVHEE
jgi:hypothetical protein